MGSKVYLKKIERDKEQEASPFELTHTIQSSPYAVEACVHRAISDAYRNVGMDLIEIRFNPMFRNRGGEHDLDKVLLSAVTGLKKACIEYPIKAGLILETDRQFTEKQHMIIAQKAVEFKKFGVVGYDISGPNPDTGFTFDNFVEAATYIRENGLGLTVHTGEFTDAEEVNEVIDKIKPHRIGHGINAVKNESVLQKVIDNDIVLELCPTSNVKTGVVKDWEEFGNIVESLKKNNVQFTINSDGPQFLSTNVKHEFELLLEKNILSEDEVKDIIRLSHIASFLNDE